MCTDVTISGLLVQCPQCGAEANAVEGTFDFLNGFISVIKADAKNRALIDELQRIVESAARSGSTKDELVRDIGKVSPKLSLAVKAAPALIGVGNIIVYLALTLELFDGAPAQKPTAAPTTIINGNNNVVVTGNSTDVKANLTHLIGQISEASGGEPALQEEDSKLDKNLGTDHRDRCGKSPDHKP